MRAVRNLIPPPTPESWRKFSERVTVSPNGCWLFRMRNVTSRKYGTFYVAQNGPLTAHRVAYFWLVGPVSDDLVIDHLCRNRRCVNPDHLEAVTQSVNVKRRVPYVYERLP